MRKETRYRHIGYSYRLTARVLLYAPSHRQDNTYHGLCYTSCGALAGMRNSTMGPPHERSIRRPTAPWANALPLSYVLLPRIGSELQSQYSSSKAWLNECVLFQYIFEEHFQRMTGGKSVFTGLKATTHFGRPQLNEIMQAVHRAHPLVGFYTNTYYINITL